MFLIGVNNIFVWIIQQKIESDKSRKNKEQSQIKELSMYKAESSGVIDNLKQYSYEVMKYHGTYNCLGVSLSAGALGGREKYENLYHQYVHHYLSAITNYKKQLEYIEDIMGSSVGWTRLRSELDSFSINLYERLSDEEKQTYESINKRAELDAENFRKVLLKIDNFLDLYIGVINDYEIGVVNRYHRLTDYLDSRQLTDLIYNVRADIINRDKYKFWKRSLFELP
ncbi:MAG: hypothetical protein IPN88_15975 [Bacteroidetes bacterium]|nr:hypothetical protein [Bacteroidota bacterium]